MGKVIVDSKTILDFSKVVQNESNKLVTILDKMNKISILYDDMVDTDAGNLFKNTIKEQIKKEKDKITVDGICYEKLFSSIAVAYNNINTEIQRSIKNERI